MSKRKIEEEKTSPGFVSGNVVGSVALMKIPFKLKLTDIHSSPSVKVWAKRVGSPAWPALVTGRDETGEAACSR